jgi:hypothetical protein
MTSTRFYWSGTIIGVQPRIRLTRSFDQRSHSYLGFKLRIGDDGMIGDESRPLIVAVGNEAKAQHGFQVGDRVSGDGVPVVDPDTEIADIYSQGTSWTEEDWVDEATAHRGRDE